MWKTLVAIVAMSSMSGCCLIGAGVGAVTAKDHGDGAIKGALAGTVVDLTLWPTLGAAGAYPGSICAPDRDVGVPGAR
jgi:hypothetical protein